MFTFCKIPAFSLKTKYMQRQANFFSTILGHYSVGTDLTFTPMVYLLEKIPLILFHPKQLCSTVHV